MVPKILGRQRPGKIGKCQLFIYSSIAQSVERMTVNHDVTGSSPVGGAKVQTALMLDFSVFMRFFFVFTVIFQREFIELSAVTFNCGCYDCCYGFYAIFMIAL